MLTLSANRIDSGFDAAGFEADLERLISRYRHQSLQELRLGPLLQQLTELAVRHGVRLPATLTLIGKAFGQMQLAAAELDPSLDPFAAAGAFYARQLIGQLRTSTNPRELFYESQKLRVRAERLVESVERLTGARPGSGLQVQATVNDAVTDAISLAGRRIALGLAATAAIIAVAASAGQAAKPRSRWVTPGLGTAASVLSAALLADVIKRP